MLLGKNLKLQYQSILIIGLCFALVSCNEPRSQRSIKTIDTGSSPIFDNSNSSTTTINRTGTGESTTGTTNTTGTTSTTTIPASIKHCNWAVSGSSSYSISSKHFSNGESASESNINLCQSSSNELDIYIQLKNGVSDTQVCLLPTYHSSSNQVYLGEPRCITANEAGNIYKVSLLKNRAGFSEYAITGVIVMRDKSYFYDAPFYQNILSPDAYIFCSQWLAQYGDSSYCTSFKNGGHYVYKQF